MERSAKQVWAGDSPTVWMMVVVEAAATSGRATAGDIAGRVIEMFAAGCTMAYTAE